MTITIDSTGYDIEAEQLRRVAESDLRMAQYAQTLLDLCDDTTDSP